MPLKVTLPLSVPSAERMAAACALPPAPSIRSSAEVERRGRPAQSARATATAGAGGPRVPGAAFANWNGPARVKSVPGCGCRSAVPTTAWPGRWQPLVRLEVRDRQRQRGERHGRERREARPRIEAAGGVVAAGDEGHVQQRATGVERRLHGLVEHDRTQFRVAPRAGTDGGTPASRRAARFRRSVPWARVFDPDCVCAASPRRRTSRTRAARGRARRRTRRSSLAPAQDSGSASVPAPRAMNCIARRPRDDRRCPKAAPGDDRSAGELRGFTTTLRDQREARLVDRKAFEREARGAIRARRSPAASARPRSRPQERASRGRGAQPENQGRDGRDTARPREDDDDRRQPGGRRRGVVKAAGGSAAGCRP